MSVYPHVYRARDAAAPSSMLAFMAATVVTDKLARDFPALRTSLATVARDNTDGRGLSRPRDDGAPATYPVQTLADYATDNGCRWAIPRPPAPGPARGLYPALQPLRDALREADEISADDLAAAATMYDQLRAGTFYAPRPRDFGTGR